MAHVKLLQFRGPQGQIVSYYRDRVVRQINFSQLVRDVRVAREHFPRYERDFVVTEIQLKR